MEAVNIKLDAFEGPLDLLYHLIEKNEIDIYDIPISKLTDQYLEYINSSGVKDMDSMSSFLIMAASLIEIKAKMLIPNIKKDEQDNAVDPREELVQKLIEYKRFKAVTEEFKVCQERAGLVLYKSSNPNFDVIKYEEDEEKQFEKSLKGITMEDIFNAFQDVMRRRIMKVDRVRSGFKSVERDLYTIDDKISYIKDMLVIHKKIRFDSIFREKAQKMEMVVTFLALLELIKMKQVSVLQKSNFDPIVISMNNGSDISENIRTGSYN